MQNVRIINQMVDTLKLHFYPSHDLNEKQLTSYNTFVDNMKKLKLEAQQIKNDDNSNRFVKTSIDGRKFQVMANSVKSFSVLLENGDITIALKHITDKSNNPVIKVEFRSEFLTRYGYVDAINRVTKFIDTILPIYNIKVSEIHLCTDFQGYDITQMDKDRMSFRNRGLQDFTEVDNTLFSSGHKKTGFSFGKGDFMLRIYDKSHQIQYKKKAGYVKTLRWEINPDYDENQKVWRVEFQFRRAYLKTLIGKDGIIDGFTNVLNSIPDLWKHATERFVHYNLSQKQCIDIYTCETEHQGKVIPLRAETIKKRKQRAGISPLWEKISTFNNVEKSYNITRHKELKKPEAEYVVNAFKGVVSTMVKLQRGAFDKQYLTQLIIEADERDLNKKGFSILDQAKLKSVEHLQDMKIQFEQNGVLVDGFDEYKNDLQKNLLETLKSIDDKEYKNRFFAECVKRGTLVYGSFN